MTPAGSSRAAGIALVVAAVAGAASQEDGLPDTCPICREGFHVPGPLCGDLTGELVDFEALSEHCDCCGHRYAGDHVPGRPCPCFERDAWEGTR